MKDHLMRFDLVHSKGMVFVKGREIEIEKVKKLKKLYTGIRNQV